MSKPKEFRIYKPAFDQGFEKLKVCRPPYFQCELDPKYWDHFYEFIEKSAYDDLLKKFDEQFVEIQEILPRTFAAESKLKIAIDALEEIDDDFGTDYADGHVMIANEALAKIHANKSGAKNE